MTRAVHSAVRCKTCEAEALCPKCGRTVSSMTPFSDWLRALPAPLNSNFVDNENLDFIWFHYRPGWFLTIEEKRYGAIPSEAQMDTHGVVAQMLDIASPATVKTLRGLRTVEYHGHYVLVFERTTPDDSAWMLINGKRTDKAGLLRLLAHGSTDAIT